MMSPHLQMIILHNLYTICTEGTCFKGDTKQMVMSVGHSGAPGQCLAVHGISQGPVWYSSLLQDSQGIYHFILKVKILVYPHRIPPQVSLWTGVSRDPWQRVLKVRRLHPWNILTYSTGVSKNPFPRSHTLETIVLTPISYRRFSLQPINSN